VCLVYPRETLAEFLQHELRWTIGLRNVRPAGHAAMIFTFGLPWTVLAAVVAPTTALAAAYVSTYLALRFAVYLTLGVWGLRDDVVRRNWWLAPLRDAANFFVWVASFFSNHIRWRGLEFQVKEGLLIPVTDVKDSSGEISLRTWRDGSRSAANSDPNPPGEEAH
jgi:ceramide glucosyltransferase